MGAKEARGLEYCYIFANMYIFILGNFLFLWAASEIINV